MLSRTVDKKTMKYSTVTVMLEDEEENIIYIAKNTIMYTIDRSRTVRIKPKA